MTLWLLEGCEGIGLRGDEATESITLFKGTSTQELPAVEFALRGMGEGGGHLVVIAGFVIDL